MGTAARFDASTDRVSFAGTMFAFGSGFTATAWVWMSVDTDEAATIARWHASSGGSTIATWATGADGLSGPNYFTAGGSVGNATGMGLGSWRMVAITCLGTTAESYVRTVGGTTEVNSGSVAVGTPTGFTIGGREPGSSVETANARICRFRQWAGVKLTQAEIEAEWASETSVRTAGLWSNHPLSGAGDLNDVSGNGRHLVAGSTALTTEDGPPIAAGVSPATFLALL